MAYWVGHRQAPYVIAAAITTAIAGTALAIAAVFAGLVLSQSSSRGAVALRPSTGPVQLSAAPLGVNVAPWDSVYTANTFADGGVNVIQPMLKAAGINQLRYGGGSYADVYNWQTNTSIIKCPDGTTAFSSHRCKSRDSLGFGQFSQQARAIGADSFVTVNYGSGTPAQAAAWVAAAARTHGQDVALWEVGNETYGCWEVNNELAGPPANYRGYKPSLDHNNPTCPWISQGKAAGIRTLATSYATHAGQFLQAMKAADPAARIGVPWALDRSVLGGTIPRSSEWNDTVLGADGKYVSFVDAHYYPFDFFGNTGGANPTDRQVLRSLLDIPSLYRSIRAGLNARDPGASVVIGETAVSNSMTTTNCTPVGALFAAGDVLSWLAVGAESVDWWNMNNGGNTTSQCVNPDFGLFTSSSPPAPETPYYGYLLASVLARPHALLGTLPTSKPSNVLGFKSALPDGRHAVAFININTRSAETVILPRSAALSGTLRTWRYKNGLATGTTSAASAAKGIRLPAESITVLETQ